jgi:hypothetical protein
MGKVDEIIKTADYLRKLANLIENYEIEPIEFSLTRANPERNFIDFTYHPPYYTFKLYYKDKRDE